MLVFLLELTDWQPVRANEPAVNSAAVNSAASEVGWTLPIVRDEPPRIDPSRFNSPPPTIASERDGIQQISQTPDLGDVVTPSLADAKEVMPFMPPDPAGNPTCDDCWIDSSWLEIKKSKLTGTWLPGSGDSLGITDIDFRTTLSARKLPYLSVTPSYTMMLLNGPSSTDLPARLHQASAEFRWMKPINQRWSYELAVSPGVYSDFQNGTSDAIRVTGRGLAIYGYSPQLQLITGVVYLNRDDVNLLPAIGMIYMPSPDVRWELIFPRPRLAARTAQRDGMERWVYLAGEFGGGSWAIERSSGANDVVTYRDYRLVSGVETQHANGWKTNIECAYVFGRTVEYRSNLGDFDPTDTAFIRLGVTY